MLDKEEIKHVAKLAKLNLSEQEITDYVVQLSKVLEYAEILNETDTSNVEPTFHSVKKIKNKFQTEGMAKSFSINEISKNAKEFDDGYIIAPAVL